MSDPTGDLLVQVMAELGVDRHEDVLPALEKRFNALVTTRTSREENRAKRLEAEAEVARLRAAQVVRRLEIVRPDDEHVEVWIGGKEVASANHDEHGWAGMGAVEETATAVARALGADVEETSDPTPKPYRYFVSYFVALAGRQGEWRYVPASKWIDLDSAIESQADLDAFREGMAGSAIPAANIQIMNFTLIDSPEW